MLVVVTHTHIPSTWEAEAGRLFQVLSSPGLHSETSSTTQTANKKEHVGLGIELSGRAFADIHGALGFILRHKGLDIIVHIDVL